VPQLHDRLSQRVAAGSVKLVIDLGEVPYMASAGIRTLVTALQSARRQSGDLRVASVQPAVARMFELAGLAQLLSIYPDVAAAVESFS
jgi:anti-sigma B factor antagonist